MATLKETLSKNLQREMAARDMTQTELAKYVGAAVPTVNWWIHGKSYPRDSQIEKMAKLFNVPVANLVTEQRQGIKVPVLGSVRAGYPALAQQEILDYEEITPEMNTMGQIFGLKIRGDSMEPKMSDGDTVLVLEQPDVESGDIAVVMVGQEDATIKRVVKNGDGITLVPFNPQYKPISFTAEEIEEAPVRIIGKAIELRSTL